ncbi:MAG: C4-dicarboxylate ABC transporter [Tindallia sp. MSAO_Bac2]|nr:MAG: C4-dicarboxylate ABC transporter [Tindallia sp. MSAO_Bac2]
MLFKKGNGKKLALIAAILVLAMLAVGCGGNGDAPVAAENGEDGGFIERQLQFGHVRPDGTSTDTDSKFFTEYVTANTDGKTTFEIYPNSQLGDYSTVQERLGIGDVDMQLAPAAPNVNAAIVLPSAPYLASNWDEAKEVFGRGSVLYEEMGKMFEEENIKMLAGYPKYFGSIITTKMPEAPGDPDVTKGVVLRVPGIRSFELTALALGYQASPIAFSEAFTAIQTGTVDGAIGSGGEGYYNSFRDVVDYYLPVNSQFEIWWIQMSMEAWNSLTEEEKAIFEEAAERFESERWEQAPGEEAEYERLLEEHGAEIIEFTDEELQAMADKVRAEVWPEIEDEYGAELFRTVTGQ